MTNANSIENLLDSIAQNNVESIGRFIMEGGDINKLSEISETNPLHAAIEYDYIESVKEIIDLGADIEIIVHGLTPLQHAVDIKCLMISQDDSESDNLDIIRILIRHGANLGATGKIRETPVQMAENYQCMSVASVLKTYR